MCERKRALTAVKDIASNFATAFIFGTMHRMVSAPVSLSVSVYVARVLHITEGY